jgi:hypothetical protein
MPEAITANTAGEIQMTPWLTDASYPVLSTRVSEG